MKAKVEKYKQPEPILDVPPMGQLIEFPQKATKAEHKTPNMKCCKTDMIDWNFRGW